MAAVFDLPDRIGLRIFVGRDRVEVGPVSSTTARSMLRRESVILLAVLTAEEMSLAEVRGQLSELVDRVQRECGRVVITRRGQPAAMIISLEELESLAETSTSWIAGLPCAISERASLSGEPPVRRR
jgi:prevent-host-death family protein